MPGDDGAHTHLLVQPAGDSLGAVLLAVMVRAHGFSMADETPGCSQLRAGPGHWGGIPRLRWKPDTGVVTGQHPSREPAPPSAKPTGVDGTPHRALRPYVREYVGYHLTGAPAVHHGIPSASATVIISFDDPLSVGWKDAPGASSSYWTMASGLHTKPALIHTGGVQHGIQLQLTPLGVRALLGVPVGVLATELVSHDELPLGIDPAVHARLAAAESWPRRFAILDAALIRALGAAGESRAARVSAPARQGWRVLAAARGGLSVAELAATTGWSARHLHARFVAEFGVSPKEAARLMRFDRARALVLGGAALADAAAVSGYADQAHLTREWTRFAGQPPRRTLAELAEFEDG